MDFMEFSKTVPVDKLMDIFRNYFEEYIAAYNMLQGIRFIKINDINIDKSSIVYSVELMKEEDKQKLLEYSSNLKINIYGKKFSPKVFIDGDLLYICIE